MSRERRRWLVVGAIFATMFFIWGAVNSTTVFFLPVLKHFGWSRARLSVALSIGWVTGGAAGPLIGWLADRVNPKRMMVAAAAVTGLLWIALSRATSFGQFLTYNGLFGVCVGASTFIPATILIAGWFERRGLALGLALAGGTIGGAVMTLVANHAISVGGWRAGYVTLGVPILLVVVPMLAFLVAPAAKVEQPRAESPPDAAYVAASLPGLELAQAMRTRSAWLVSVAQLLAGLSTGIAPHFVAYLSGIGYTATFAASVVSLYLVVTTIGTILGGPLADRFGARSATAFTFLLASVGFIGLSQASHASWLVMNILAGGFAAGAITVQMPLVLIESFGLKRFGSMQGITGVFFTLGAATSPIVTGRIFDLTGSYAIAIAAFIAMAVLASLAVAGCRPFIDGQQTAAGGPTLSGGGAPAESHADEVQRRAI